MTGAEMAARMTSARAVLSDFERATGVGVGWRDWQVWAQRLGQHLQFVLDAPRGLRVARVDGSQAASRARVDDSALLSPADLQIVLGALSDAAEYRGHSHGSRDRYRAQATAYRALAYRLGDDR